MSDPQKAANRILNVLDPPKDLSVDQSPLTNKAHGEVIKSQIKALFSSANNLPEGFMAVGDTKKAIKSNLGAENDAANANKPLTSYLIEKANRIQILREKHSTGCDARPSDLYVSQDSGPGPSSIIKDPKIIITPGTIMDPATKTKEGATYLVDTFRTLPKSYIEQINMNDVITDVITMTESPDAYNIKIPTNIGGAARTTNGKNGPGMIDAKLDKGNFKKKAGTGNPDGIYFDGNATKNTEIFNLFDAPGASGIATLKGTNTETSKNTIKKYILVKELGDTLQVIWLKYILDQNGEYTAANTVLSTGDTVVWYRSIINKVPVIVTYMGKTNYWRAQDNDAVMIAAFKKTIRDELIADNESVIQILDEISKLPRTAGTNAWILDITYLDKPYNACVKYLKKLVKKLQNLNNDALISIENVPTIDAAKAIAADYHFTNPFVKKGNIWKTNDKVINILPNSIPFHAKQFKFPSTIESKLADAQLFYPCPEVQEGGGQKGGAGRETLTKKISEASQASTATLAKEFMKKRLLEWQYTSVVEYPTSRTEREKIRAKIEEKVKEAKDLRDGTTTIVGDANNFMRSKNEEWVIFSNNLNGTILQPHVLYLFVRDNYPEIFIYAGMMKLGLNDLVQDIKSEIDKIGSSRIPENVTRKASLTTALPRARGMRDKFRDANVDINLKNKFKLEYKINDMAKMLVTGIDGGAIPANATAAATSSATKEAIFLANRFLTDFNYLLTKGLADFLAYAMANILTTAEKTAYDITPTAEDYATFQMNVIYSQEGGGKEPLDPITSAAMDNYEIYYSKAIKYAYEDRELTQLDLENTLRLIESKIKMAERVKPPPQYGIPMKTGRDLTDLTSMIQTQIPTSIGVFGGKRKRVKKTHKKKKSKQRKTRKNK